MFFKQFFFLLLLTCLILAAVYLFNHTSPPAPLSLFPLKNYDQSLSPFINPNDHDYQSPLMSPPIQKWHVDNFYRHYLGTLSPWNERHVKHIIEQQAPDDIKSIESDKITSFDNKNHDQESIGYGENFRPHTAAWNNAILATINLSQFGALKYDPNNRAITLDNLHARALPTDDVHYYHYKIAGQGYPFDNLQISSLWVGTPVYILGESKDHAWTLVLTPDFIAWVKSTGVVRVNPTFIHKWAKQAKKQLVAITQSNTSLMDLNGHYLLTTYIGTFLPAEIKKNKLILWVPTIDTHHHAYIQYAIADKQNTALMPMTLTPQHVSTLIKNLIGRPYGWGNMYFYNDCSSELKNLLTPFGIWLPRHSSEQVNIGNSVDLSNQSMKNRLNYLKNQGRKFVTLIYVGNHIMLYIGNYQKSIIMTYQNVWGLKPHSGMRRSVIGKSVLFPLLESYPEDKKLESQANKKYFIISFLDQLPKNYDTDVSLKQLIDQ